MLAGKTVDPVVHAVVFKPANNNTPLADVPRVDMLMDRWFAAEHDVRVTARAAVEFDEVPEHLF